MNAFSIRGIVGTANGWTGGQYSLFRWIFGAYLLVHFAQLVPWGAEMFSNQGAMPGAASPVLHLFPNMFALCDSPAFVTGVLCLAAGLSAILAVGWHDRFAAIGLWYIWACLFGRNPLISNPGLPYVGLLLLVHACLRPAPYGSLSARGRIDPAGGWYVPHSLLAAVWILMALGYTYSGYTKLCSPSWVDGTAIYKVLNNPLARPGVMRDLMLMLPSSVLIIMTWGALSLELFYTPLACFPRVRPYIWLLMLMMHLGLIFIIDFADLSLGMVMLHLFTFNPSWIRRKEASAADLIFYDGQCGLCHGAIRFLVGEDTSSAKVDSRIGGEAFRFAPLEGELIKAKLSEQVRRSLPDSMAVLCSDGTLLLRSQAWIYLLSRLGGIWRIISWLAKCMPPFLRDAIYDQIAAVRGKLFARPADVCPILPPSLRGRFAY